MLANARPPVQHAARVLLNVAQASAGVLGVLSGQKPSERFSAAEALPPATTGVERAEDLFGNVAGFTLATLPLAAIPGASVAGAAGVGAAAQERDIKSAAISGVTTAGAAGLAGRAAGAIQRAGVPRGAPAWVRPGPAVRAASHGPGTVAFGAAQPLAAAAMHRLTGEKDYPMPGPQEWAQGTGDMIAVALVSGLVGKAGALAAKAPPEVARHAQVIADAVRPPAGMTPRSVAASQRLSEALNKVLVGKRVWLDLPDGAGRGVADVQRVFAYRTPQGAERVTVLVQDATSPVPFPVRYESSQALVDAVGNRPRVSEAQAAEPVVPAAEVERNLPEQRAARLAEVEPKLARLEANEPPRNDKGYRRWAQRVERLRAERDRLGAAAPAATPSPAAVSPEKSSANITPPRETAPNYRQMGTEDVLGLAGQGDAQARAEWERRQQRGRAPEPPNEAGGGGPATTEQPTAERPGFTLKKGQAPTKAEAAQMTDSQLISAWMDATGRLQALRNDPNALSGDITRWAHARDDISAERDSRKNGGGGPANVTPVRGEGTAAPPPPVVAVASPAPPAATPTPPKAPKPTVAVAKPTPKNPREAHRAGEMSRGAALQAYRDKFAPDAAAFDLDAETTRRVIDRAAIEELDTTLLGDKADSMTKYRVSDAHSAVTKEAAKEAAAKGADKKQDAESAAAKEESRKAYGASAIPIEFEGAETHTSLLRGLSKSNRDNLTKRSP
ncbi:MAG: hypothetical protein AAB262_06050, partial [Elusimicrobiota bacterium]